MIFVAIVVAGYFGINPPGFVAQVVAFAFGLAAASFFPVILLGHLRQAHEPGRRHRRHGGRPRSSPPSTSSATASSACQPWFFGISAQGIGTVGMLLNLVTTFVVSRMTEPPPQEIQDMVESLRSPKGAGQTTHA